MLEWRAGVAEQLALVSENNSELTLATEAGGALGKPWFYPNPSCREEGFIMLTCIPGQLHRDNAQLQCTTAKAPGYANPQVLTGIDSRE